MKPRLTRREFLAGSAALGIAATTPVAALQAADPTVDSVVSQLATDLTDEHRELLAEALRGNAEAARARRRYALPENSEPCFVFRPTVAGERR